MTSHHINKITLSTFNSVLSRYTPAVPEALQELDALRYDTIPTAVAKRPGKLHVTKGEVEKLVEWKLKHGTFRPKLLQLVQSNPASTIQETTTSSFELLPDVIPALKSLINLKGIGPATASLLLSVAQPGTVPFFSDEVFRWCMWDEPGSPIGWQRKIKYNTKEYEMLLEKVGALVKRLVVRAVDVERVAWVLGKEGIDIDIGEHNEEIGEADVGKGVAKVEDAVVERKPKQEVKTGTKRKASESKPLVEEGTRKSTRMKK